MLSRVRRFAGDALGYLQKVDDKYAEGVRNLVMPKSPDGSAMSVARSVGGAVVGAPLGHGLAKLGPDATVAERALKYAIPATSAAVRYGLPAAGAVALADGIGNLYDAAEEIPIGPFGNQQSMGTLY